MRQVRWLCYPTLSIASRRACVKRKSAGKQPALLILGLLQQCTVGVPTVGLADNGERYLFKIEYAAREC